MKPLTKRFTDKWLLLLSLAMLTFISCQKETKPLPNQEEIASERNRNGDHGHLKQTKTFSSDVVVSWINMQLQMLKVPLPAGTAGQATDRCQAYCGHGNSRGRIGQGVAQSG